MSHALTLLGVTWALHLYSQSDADRLLSGIPPARNTPGHHSPLNHGTMGVSQLWLPEFLQSLSRAGVSVPW